MIRLVILIRNIYNAVHWNGQSWELKEFIIIINGQNFTHRITVNFTFNENDIWFE